MPNPVFKQTDQRNLQQVAHAEQQINSRLGDIASLLESGRLFFYVNTPRGFERILHESKSTEEVSPASENR